jgi:tetratricopeptide (TPR) repeat protein
MFRSLGAARSAAVMEMNLGVKAFAQGRWGEAAQQYESARKEFERVGDVTQAAYAAANLGEVLVGRGTYPEADAVLTAARDTLRASEYLYAAVFCEIQLARLAIATGDLSAAVSDLTSLLEEARSIGDVGLAVEAWIHLADAISRSGEPDRALVELSEARRVLDDDSSPLGAPLARITATVLMQQGELSRAGEQLSNAMELAREQRLVYEEAQALLALERLARMEGRDSEADAALHEAKSLVQRVGASLPVGDDA